MKIVLFLLTLLVSLPAFAQLGSCKGSTGDSIFHEDFGSGNASGPLPVGTTNYNYISRDPEDGQYTVSNRIGQDNGSWHSTLPETAVSGGNALVVNASFTSGKFYSTSITDLCEYTTYEFSAFILNVYDRASGVCENGGIPVDARFEIWDETDNILLKEGSTGVIPSTTSPQWSKYALTFQTKEDQGSVILKMFNNGEGGCGNDLAIDDIVFRTCGDLTTITTSGINSDQVAVCREETPVSFTLEATPDFTVYSTHYFQWQERREDGNWSNIPGETGGMYSTPPLSASSYYRVKVAENEQNLQNNLCSSASEEFYIEIIETPNPPVSNGDVEICGEEPYVMISVEVEADEIVNWYDAPSGGNLLAEGTTTYTPFEEGIFYAEAVKEGYSCNPGARTPVKFSILKLPFAEDETLYLCGNSTLNLDAGGEDLNYLWSTGETSKTIMVENEGQYSVQLTTAEGCSKTKYFKIIAQEEPVIREVISIGSTVNINLENQGNFEFSLNGISYQSSNIFEQVDGGIYTINIKDTSNCNSISIEFVHVVTPAFITPNNDGYNDYFELKEVSFLGNSIIYIFNRYGKLIASGAAENFRFDGNLKGKGLPAEDYWYRITIEGYKEITGHFSLVR